MKLTKDQIQELYTFTRAHYVEYYDLQTELVDHLANGIEEQWRQHPNISFEEAKQREFKKFGVFGFMEVVEERQKAMTKKYYAIIFQHMKAYFGFAQILLTLFLVFLLMMFLQMIHPEHQQYWVLGIFILGITPMYISMTKHSKKLKKKKRKLMLEEMLLAHAGIAQLFALPIHIFNFSYTITSTVQFFAVSFGIVVLLQLIYVITFIIPAKAEQLLEENYPEYKIA